MPLRLFTTVSNSLLSLVYPQPCGTCGASVEEHSLGTTCSDCWDSTRLFTGSETLCEKCGAFLNNAPATVETFCGRCESHYYDQARAAGVYEGAIRNAVLGLKSTSFLSTRIKDKLTEAFEISGFASAELLIPVPLSRNRLAERGHNQAAVIGDVVSTKLGIELDIAAIERAIDTP